MTVRLVLEVDEGGDHDGALVVRLLVVNNSYDTVRLDHRLLVGPNVASAPPLPVSVEPSLHEEQDNITVLQPWCLYGRLRPFPDAQGEVTFHGYLVEADRGGLLADRPLDSDLLVAAAEPLTVMVVDD